MLRARFHSGVRIWLLLASLLPLALLPPASESAVTPPSQSEVEAVYLFDFGKFVRWPSGVEQGPVQVCAAASPAFVAALQKTVSSDTIDGRPLEVRRVTRPAEETGCAMLFIEAAQHLRPEDLLQNVAGKPTLTVSDMPGFLNRGGMIQFQLVEKRVRFSVNLDAVARARLTMSSELLKVALSVKGKMPEGGAQ